MPLSFKPCYKWITFNTIIDDMSIRELEGFKPCYKWITFNTRTTIYTLRTLVLCSFKPCYKWITFNTYEGPDMTKFINAFEF